MEIDLQGALQETASEYGKRLRENSELLCVENLFASNLVLVPKLRTAYAEGDLYALARIPLWLHGETAGENSISFDANAVWCDYDYGWYLLHHILGKKFTLPFDNETTGSKLYFFSLTFGGLEQAGSATKFYTTMQDAIDKFESQRKALFEEIMWSSAYIGAMQSLPEIGQCDDRGTEHEQNLLRLKVLRRAYWQEECKRRDRILDLCDKAEHIFEWSNRLYEACQAAKHLPSQP